MFFTTAININSPAVAYASAVQIGEAKVIKAKHATNFVLDNID
jgi:hypothetical protein